VRFATRAGTAHQPLHALVVAASRYCETEGSVCVSCIAGPLSSAQNATQERAQAGKVLAECETTAPAENAMELSKKKNAAATLFVPGLWFGTWLAKSQTRIAMLRRKKTAHSRIF